MVYKSDKIPNVCSRLNKLGFMALQEPHGYDTEPSCYVYLTGGNIRIEVPNDDTPLNDIINPIKDDLMAAQADLDMTMKYIDWHEVKKEGW